MEVIKNLEDISKAIDNSKKIEFEYWKYDIETNKLQKKVVSKPKVTPYAIIYNKQQFYMIGIKDGQDKFYNYRLDRIKTLKILEEVKTIFKTSSEIKEYAESLVEMFGGEKEEIEAVCSTFLLDAVYDQFGKNAIIQQIDDDKFKLTVQANLTGIRMWAIKYIDCVEIIRPKELRNEIKDIINKAKIKYEN
jgi:predicted DNA-binding transcriptional regulator YafY